MNIVLFCENRYAIDILLPIHEEAQREGGHEVLWYVHRPRIPDFPLSEDVEWTNDIGRIYDFSPHCIFVPGNIVPYYLPGVKIQVFHGYAAEKKDHWVIRRYFDTYFTQGPYFTSHFEALAHRYGDFEVLETGWTRQDWVARHRHDFDDLRRQMLEQNRKQRIVLYAPTFSPKLTSIPHIRQALVDLVDKRDVLLLVKFHPLTKNEWVEEYKQLAAEHDAIKWVDDYQISKYMLMADVMISDTSSTIYEFLLLDKPVVTLRAISKELYWRNIESPDQLIDAVDHVADDRTLTEKRKWIIDNYDPHTDGLVARRMIDGAKDYIARHGIPEKRKLNIWRKYTSIKTFGRIKRK
ncbi:MAG: CDP-glycerol glycerophosphotransferase family protein [Prevotellaceae bacterium]|nr:CDP-glycerol glycerophosphotransferase family protein [Prevotellaceae bacterium]MDY2633446.1 CDP-glycerol glycerophosphotransferase family protein [Prevotella sp.]